MDFSFLYLGRTDDGRTGGGSRPPRTPPIASAFGDTDGEFFGRKILGRIFFDRKNFGRKIFARFFSWGGLGGRSRFYHFKKFAKANFLKWCRGGVWGGFAPLRNLRYPCLAPRGGLGGFAPSGISVTRALPPQRPCLAPVPCPQFFFVQIFSSKFFSSEFFSSEILKSKICFV